MKNGYIKISVQITREQNNRLEEFAKQNNLTKSELIRQSIVANSAREAFMTKAICLLCQLDSAAKTGRADQCVFGNRTSRAGCLVLWKRLPNRVRCA